MSGGTLVGREQTLTFDLASTQLYKGAAAILLLTATNNHEKGEIPHDIRIHRSRKCNA